VMFVANLASTASNGYFSNCLTLSFSIMDREKQLSILYQKQGRATQFANKAARDEWLQREIDDLQRILSSHLAQVLKITSFDF